MSDPLPPAEPQEPASPADSPAAPVSPTTPGDPATAPDAGTAPGAASGRPYEAPSLDGPQYVIPAYAAPGSAGETLSQAPAAAPPAHAYATPAYALPPGAFPPPAQVTSLDVVLPEASQATLSPAAETGSFAVQRVTGTTMDGGATRVSGTVSGRFADHQEFVGITAIARDATGAIVGVGTAYVEAVPGDGTPVPFEAWLEAVPPDVTFEASARL